MILERRKKEKKRKKRKKKKYSWGMAEFGNIRNG